MKRNQLMAGFLFVLAATITVVSCNKQDRAGNPTAAKSETVAKEKINALAQRFTEPIGSDHGKLQEQYKNLTDAELKAFWRQINEINKSEGRSKLTEAEFSAIFDKLNNESRERFGVSFNKVSAESENSVMGFRDNLVQAKPPKDPPPPTGCIFYYYPVNLYEDNNAVASPPFFTYTIVDYWPGDCDGVEVVYQGLWFKSKSTTPLGYQTGPVYPIGRYVDGNTRVLFKRSVMMLAFGSIEAINDNKRMAYGGIAESRK